MWDAFSTLWSWREFIFHFYCKGIHIRASRFPERLSWSFKKFENYGLYRRKRSEGHCSGYKLEVYVHPKTYTCMCIYKYPYIYIDTYTYTYIYIYICTCIYNIEERYMYIHIYMSLISCLRSERRRRNVGWNLGHASQAPKYELP